MKIERHDYEFFLEFSTDTALTDADKTELRCALSNAVNEYNKKQHRMKYYSIDFTSYRFRKGDDGK